MIVNAQGRTESGYNDRIRSLELRVVQMEAVLKGIADEISDLRSHLTSYISRENEHSARLLAEEPGAAAPLPRLTEPPEVVKEVAAPDPMVLIMQPDGTLKPERRLKSDYVVIR